jgi:UPF0755 protein
MKLPKSLIILIIIAIFSAGTYFFYTEGSLPVNKNDKSPTIFVVEQGENLETISKHLENNDLIRSKLIFYLIVKKLGIEKKIQYGEFRLSQSMGAEEIAKALTHGTTDKWITIIEGLRKEEIADIIATKFPIKEIEFINTAPEGYLFPDTYLIPTGSNTDAIVKILTDTMNSKFTPDLMAKAQKLGLTKNQVIILASLVEREARTESDRRQVASVFLKRLNADWPLQLDATVQYALGYQADEKTWWKKELRVDDLKIKSPYNTYENKGLTPGPICNPSFSSITAVVNANPDTPYWYYLADTKGVTHFAVTLEEHDANIKKYLQ